MRSCLALMLILFCLSAIAQQTAPTGDHSSGTPAPASIPDLTPDKDGRLSQQQMQQLARVVVEKYIENYKLERNYTYIDRQVQNNLDGNGKTKSTEIKTYEILEIYGEQVWRLR
jgi:hypothetical protein